MYNVMPSFPPTEDINSFIATSHDNALHDDEEFMIEDMSSVSSSPSIPDENINFDLLYTLYTFVATVEGQISVIRGDALVLMDDSNKYWWLVKILTTNEVGYVPAENIETPYERLARLNKHRNIGITSATIHDTVIPQTPQSLKRVTIGDESTSTVFHYNADTDSEEETEDNDSKKIHKVDAQYDHSPDIILDGNEAHEWKESTWNDRQDAYGLEADTTGDITIVAGNIGELFSPFHTQINIHTTAEDIAERAIDQLGLVRDRNAEYYISMGVYDREEYIFSPHDNLLSILMNRSKSMAISSLHTLNPSSHDHSVTQLYLHKRQKDVEDDWMYIKVRLSPTNASINCISDSTQSTGHDKIIAVKAEYSVDKVTHIALNEFCIAEDEVECSYDRDVISRQMGQYGLSIRGEQGAELSSNELMSSVLCQQKSTSPNHSGSITSHLLFILSRKEGSLHTADDPHRADVTSLITDNVSNPLYNEESVDSISNRQLCELNLPLSRFMEDRRLSGSDNGGLVQEHRSSLSQYQGSLQDTTPIRNNNSNNNNCELHPFLPPPSSSSLTFPSANHSSPIQPSTVLGNTSTQDTPVSSGYSLDYTSLDSNSMENTFYNNISTHNNNIDITPTSSSSIMARSNSNQPPSTVSSDRRKESLKQQLKRFVGWGSSKNKKQTPTPLTTPFSSNQQSNITTSLHSPSEISLASAPSIPLPPTPGTPRSTGLKSRQGSQDQRLEIATPVSMSRRTSDVTSSLVDPTSTTAAAPTATLTTVIALPANKRLSTVSSVTSGASSTPTEEIKDVVEVLSTESDIESIHEVEQTSISHSSREVRNEPTIKMVQESHKVITAEAEPNLIAPVVLGEISDIQAQYAMWMNSQSEESTIPPNQSIPPAVMTHSITPAAPTTVATMQSVNPIQNHVYPPVNSFPNKNTFRNKAFAVSEKSVTPSTLNSTASVSNISTVSNSTAASSVNSVSGQTKPLSGSTETYHPIPCNNGQDLDDLFLLVAHGVDFLTNRENTKWEEEGGYEFHPWNRPQSSFAVQSKDKKKAIKEISDPTILEKGATETDAENTNEDNNTSAAMAMARSLLSSSDEEDNKQVSPPMTPIPQHIKEDKEVEEAVEVAHESSVAIAKRILGAKTEPTPVIQEEIYPVIEHSTVDDEELQRIVAAHILF
ncbi:hypothetical protein BDB01DRAFT_830573 [Pilobolus umbonatus]|nr:hypothetical protein BDB01DRAFT_830573 [Pilobolus umbonatus]